MQEDVSLGSFHYNYIKALSFYEKKIAEARQLIFKHHVLPPPADFSLASQASLEQLGPGANTELTVALTLVRVMHLSHCTYMLATSSRPFTLKSLVVVAVVMPQQEEHPTLDIRNFQLSKKSEVKVYSPFKVKEDKQTPVSMIVVSIKNLKPLKNAIEKRLLRSSEQLRQQANSFFKAKRYVEAIHLYEAALTNIHHYDQRKLSILYANTAACLFQLRLYDSCLMLSEVAIMIDPTYNKGFYRKIRSLLEMRRFTEVAPLMLGISELISKPELESLNERFTHLMAQDAGVFNWQALLKESCPQGEYFSSKIGIVDVNGQMRIQAKQDIDEWELVMISRPLIYIQQSGTNFKDSFMSFLKEIENYYLYDQVFEENIYMLPCKCHPCLPQREEYYNQFRGQARPLPKKELFNKMQRCIFQEKSIDKPIQSNGYGIWRQMFYLQNKCTPNCSGIHLNGYWLVTAIKPIKAGSFLSVDLIAGVEGLKRKQTLNIKMEQECECEICAGLVLREGSFTTIQNLYDEIEVLQSAKKKKMHIWNIINSEWEDRFTLFQGDFNHLIYYYIYYIEKQPDWDDFLNLLRLKEENQSEEINKNIDDVAIRLLSQFLDADEPEVEKIYQLIVAKVLCVLEE